MNKKNSQTVESKNILKNIQKNKSRELMDLNLKIYELNLIIE